MYEKEIRQYLDSDQSDLGGIYYNSRLKEFVDQRFGRVCINVNKPGSLQNQEVLIEWLQTTLNLAAEKMTVVIERSLTKYLRDLRKESRRRELGAEPIRQDVVGEWLLENHRVNKAAASSMIGEIIDKNSEIYESILDVTKHLFGCLDVDYSIRGYWPEWCDAGFYVIRVENNDTRISISVGWPCKLI